jgi:DNA-binding NarL/FixJ family response regulator
MRSKKSKTPSRGKVSKRHKILIADHQPLIREKLAEVIAAERDLEVCAVADVREDLTALIANLEPDLVMIEIAGKHGQGVAQIQELCEADPDVAVLVFSMGPCEKTAVEALHAGAIGYICKSESADEILEAVRQSIRKGPRLCRQMTSQLVTALSSGFADAQAPALRKLNARERKVFDLIGHGLDNRQIATQLRLAPAAVESCRSALRRKLDLGAAELHCAAQRWAEKPSKGCSGCCS